MEESGKWDCISEGIPFSQIVTLLEKIKEAKGTKSKENFLKKYLVNFEEYRQKIAKDMKVENLSFFPVLRLLLPDIDQNRGSYGIKETTMGRLYVSSLGLDKKSAVAKTLLEGHSAHGDYADIVFNVMKARSKEKSSITVFDVNQGLDTMVNHYRNGHSKKIDEVFIKFIAEMTANEQKWLVRIILRKLPLGFGAKSILNAMHPQAFQVFNQTTNLAAVCQLMDGGGEGGGGGEEAPQELVKIFCHVKPMLLYRPDINNLKEILSSGEFMIETKMDGERFQIHRSGAEYRYFSRNSKDYTAKFGKDSFSYGSLTRKLHPLIASSVQSVILDGEMMTWNRNEKSFFTKGDNFDVKNIDPNDPNICPVFCAYDILFLNGQSVIRKPYAERRRLMKTVLKEEEGVLMILGHKEMENEEHITKCLNEAIDDGEEGIVFKNMQSYYCPGERDKKNGWFKMKPDYGKGVVSDLDLLIIGGFYDKRKRFIKSYLVGVYANGPEEKTEAVFHAVGKVSGGLKVTERRDLNKDLQWKPVEFAKGGSKRSAITPKGIEWKNAVPDVWIEPSQSIVLEVKATELSKTDVYRSSHTLKFPRISSIRRDKPWFDACSLAEYEQLCRRKTLVKRHITSHDLEKGEKPLKRPKSNSVIPTYRRDFQDIEKLSSVCENLVFCVLSTEKKMPSIEELRELIIKHGGKIVENPGPTTYAVIAGDLTLNVKKYAEKKQYNIVKVEWVVKHLGHGKIPPKLPKFHPKYMICSTRQLEDEFTKSYDEYGISYTEPTDLETLKEVLDGMVLDRSQRLLKREQIAFQALLYKQVLS